MALGQPECQWASSSEHRDDEGEGRTTDVASFTTLRSQRGLALLGALSEALGDASAEDPHSTPEIGIRYDEAVALRLATRWRGSPDADLVPAALTMLRLRDRARAKFGAAAATMWFTPDGLEQATRPVVAARHAARFAAWAEHSSRGVLTAGGSPVSDLGSGIGSDLMAFARAGLAVDGVDRDPLTAAIARANLADHGLDAVVRTADVGDVPLAGAVFADPARRHSGRRIFDPDATSPPLHWVLALAAERAVGVKVAPGIPHDRVPPGWEAEWVSVGGDVVEAALWSPQLRDHASVRRRATLLPGEHTLTDLDLVDPVVGPVCAVLYEPDGAVIRSGLVAALQPSLDAHLIDPTIAYLTSDTLTPTPFASAYRIDAVLPANVKRLKAHLRSVGVGRVVVKKRGSALDVDVVRQALKGPGSGEATIILTRVAGAPMALVARPAGRPATR